MNRALYLVIAPAFLIAGIYLGLFYGKVIPRWVAFSVGGLCALLLLLQSLRHNKK